MSRRGEGGQQCRSPGVCGAVHDHIGMFEVAGEYLCDRPAVVADVLQVREWRVAHQGGLEVACFHRGGGGIHRGVAAPFERQRDPERFDPNIQSKRYWVPSERRSVRLQLSTTAIKTIDRIGIDAAVARIRARGIKLGWPAGVAVRRGHGPDVITAGGPCSLVS